MTVPVALIAIAETGELALCDTIMHEGVRWLVPEWLEAPTEGRMRPRHIIRPPEGQWQAAPPGQQHQWVLRSPVPKAVIEGTCPPEGAAGFAVVRAPNVYQMIPKGSGALH